MTRKLLFLSLLLAAMGGSLFAPILQGQAEIPHFASAPATCDPTRGQIYYDTTLKALQTCTATNTWASSSSSSSPTIITASSRGAALNTSLSSGGGTNDTAVLQAILSAVPAGGLELVMDGPALVTGLNISSNTTIRCQRGAGFYLANSSNREILRNVNRSGSVRTDTNIKIEGCYLNGNKANQSGFQQADNTILVGIGFYGITKLVMRDVQMFNASAWGTGIYNASDVLVDNYYGQATTAVSNLSTDGIDIRGPSDNVTLRRIRSNSGDDAIALNTRAYTNAIAGPFNLGGAITNVLIDDVQLDGAWAGVDIITESGNKADGISIYHLRGTVQNYALWLNRDPFNTPNLGSVGTVLLEDSNVQQTGSQFGSLVSTGLYAIDSQADNVKLKDIRLDNAPTYPHLVHIDTSTTANPVDSLEIDGVAIHDSVSAAISTGRVLQVDGLVNRVKISNGYLWRPSGATQNGNIVQVASASSNGISYLAVSNFTANNSNGFISESASAALVHLVLSGVQFLNPNAGGFFVQLAGTVPDVTMSAVKLEGALPLFSGATVPVINPGTTIFGAGIPAAGLCVAASGGAQYLRTDGTTTTTLYVCDNSTHVWTAK